MADNAAIQPARFATLPFEIRASVYGHLEMDELRALIKRGDFLGQDAAAYAITWKIPRFDIFQLMELYDWCRENEVWDMIPYILDAIRVTLREMLDRSKHPLPHGFFILDYFYVKQMHAKGKTPSDTDIEIFISMFYTRFHEVQEFCADVADCNPNGTVERWPPFEPVVKTWMSHIIFSYAVEYINRELGGITANAFDVSLKWHKFHRHLCRVFGPKASELLYDALPPHGFLFGKYQNLIANCSANWLPIINRSFVSMSNPVPMMAYGPYALSLGPMRALEFLRENPAEIWDIQSTNASIICAWGEAWESFPNS